MLEGEGDWTNWQDKLDDALEKARKDPRLEEAAREERERAEKEAAEKAERAKSAPPASTIFPEERDEDAYDIERNEEGAWLPVYTQRIRERLKGAEAANFIAGRYLSSVEQGKIYRESEYETFEDYLAKELPELEAPWAYVLIMVSHTFEVEHAKAYGIAPLNELLKLKREVFPDTGSRELLEGQHTFAAANGEQCVLDFQADHSVRRLKTLVAEARASKMSHNNEQYPLSQKAIEILNAMKRAAEGLEGLKWDFVEKKGRASLEMSASAAVLQEVIRRAAGTLGP